MLQEIKTFRNFIKDDHKKQFAFMPMQVESCILLKAYEEDEKGVHRVVLHIFDSKTNYLGTIENPHYIPDKK